MCDPQQSGILSSSEHHRYSTSSKQCLYITFSGCTRSPSVRCGFGTSPEALPLHRATENKRLGGSDGIRRAAARTAGQAPGSPLPGAPAGAAPSAESRERRRGSSGPAVAGPGPGSAPRVSLSSAPAAALPQPPPSCRSPPTRG